VGADDLRQIGQNGAQVFAQGSVGGGRLAPLDGVDDGLNGGFQKPFRRGG